MIPGLVPLPRPAMRITAKMALAMCGIAATFILDIGDSNSSDLSAQQVSDVSGNANHWNRGSTSGAEATDPSLNGTAGGLSRNEYLGFDGGDFLTPAGSHTYDDDLHRDGATFSLLAYFYPGAVSAAQDLFANTNSATLQGIEFLISATANVQIIVNNGTGVARSQSSGGANVTASAWHFLATSINENGGAAASFLIHDDSLTSFDAAYTTPGVGNPNTAPEIGGRGGTSVTRIILNGGRLAILVLVRSAVSTGQQRLFRALMKGRFLV